MPSRETKEAPKARNEYAGRYPGAVPLHGGSETFKWKVGEPLEGYYLGLSEGSLGGQMVRIQTGTGVEVASAPTVLAKALSGIKSGTKVAIIFTGTEKSKKGQDVKLFEVYALKS